MINRQDYLSLRATLVEDLTDDWSPHVSLIADINRALHAEDVDLVTAETLIVLKRLIDEKVVVPGEVDLDAERFIAYSGSKEEVWMRIERQIPADHRAKYDFHLWFDLGIEATSRKKEPNQAPEPTPTTVTPPAGQEARQP